MTTENKYFRSTWANINKGLALILLAIPTSLLMVAIWIGFPVPTTCDIPNTGMSEKCDGTIDKNSRQIVYEWNNPEIAELYWQIGRLEITFMVIFAITMISYIMKYDV